MFDRFRKESPVLQLYGKLPIAKDYLRVGASKGAALELRDWLDHAFSTRAGPEGRATLAWPMRFLLGSANGEPLQGTVWPSTDLGGERPFPFAAFVERRRRALADAVEESFRRLPMVWTAVEAAYTGYTHHADGEAFLTAMRGQEIEVNVPLSPAPERVPWEAWVHSIWPGEGQEGLVQALASLGRLRGSTAPVPIRFPLVAGVDDLAQLHVWWSALTAMGLLKPGNLPTCFFPGPDAPADVARYCAFFFRPLTVELTRWLAPARDRVGLGPGDFARDQACRLAPTGPVPETVPSLVDSMRGALATARARS